MAIFIDVVENFYFKTLLNQKYYDLYNNGESNDTTTKEKAIMGDATWETMRFYSTNPRFMYSDSPWSFRGAYHSLIVNSSIAHTCAFPNCSLGTNAFSFRIVLIA